ncbi:MAG: pyruvate carboxyltransferase [Rhodospirillales bacterium]|nr:pyruvate carboxyltransferase [Rhodospirillales bacterium]
MTQIQLVEVGARDGLQNEKVAVSTEAKLAFINRMIDAGIKRLEATSFVNPKLVPQMADAAEVMAGVPRDRGVSYIGLVLNKKGFDRAIEAGVDEVGCVVVASDTFGQKNQGQTIEDSIRVWHELSRAAAERGVKASLTVSAAFGCPFEGEVPLARVRDIVEACMKSPGVDLAVADTIGVGVPSQVTEMLRALKPLARDVPLRVHFHNTRNTGIANVAAAIAEGVTYVDASIGGIGGCPFAPRATGNVPTEDVLYMLQRMGIETGIDLERVIEAANWIETQLGKTVPGMVSKAGGFPAPAAKAA